MKTRALLALFACVAIDATSIGLHAAGGAPTIVRQTVPAVSTKPGGAFGYTVHVTGAESFQWFKDGVALPGKTSAGLGIMNAQPGDAGSYTLTATNAQGSVTSRPLRVYVTADPGFPWVRAVPGLVFRNGGVGSTLLVAEPHGTGPYTFQWYRDSEPIPGETGQTLTVEHSAARGDETIFVTMTNEFGTASGNYVAVTNSAPPAAPPTITSQPAAPSSRIAPGTTVTLSVGASGTMLGYAWFRNGRLLPGMVPTLTIENAQVSDAGEYHVIVANPIGSVQSQAVTLNIAPVASSEILSAPPVPVVTAVDGPEVERIVNVSARSLISTGADPLIAGFVVSGSQPKSVLIRAVGPGLLPLGVTDALANPQVALFRGSSLIQANDDWSAGESGAAIAAATARVGAFPLAAGSRDAAIVASLEPGSYTAHVSNAGGADGIALVEIYDAAENAVSDAAPRLANISTRSFGGSGDRTLIAGIVVRGDSPQRVLIRGIGPALEAQNVASPMSDPLLAVYRGATLIGKNDNWSAADIIPVPPLIVEIPPPVPPPPSVPGVPIPVSVGVDGIVTAVTTPAISIESASVQTGAFPLPAGSRDAAILLTLDPGAYTAHLAPAPGSTTGPAMIEAYEVRSTPIAPPVAVAPPLLTPGAGL